MLCDPADNEDVENVVVPSEIVPVPRVVEGLVLVSEKLTVPVAVKGDTLAVNVTNWPSVDGFCDDKSVVVVWLKAFPNGTWLKLKIPRMDTINTMRDVLDIITP